MPTPEPEDQIIKEAEGVVRDALANLVEAGEGIGEIGPKNPLQDLLYMRFAGGRSVADAGPVRRNKIEYTMLPSGKEALHKRGMKFLQNLGCVVDPERVIVVNRDDFLEININEESPGRIAQVTLTASRKGEVVVTSLGEFFQRSILKGLVETPLRFDRLRKTGVALSDIVMSELAQGEDNEFSARSGYEVGDDDDGMPSLTSAMHLMECLGEVATRRDLRFALPLLAMKVTVRDRWPAHNSLQETVVIIDPISDIYESLDDVIEEDPRASKHYTRKIDALVDHIQRMLEKRGVSIPLRLPPYAVYTDGNRRYIIEAVEYDFTKSDKYEFVEADGEDEDDDDTAGVNA